MREKLGEKDPLIDMAKPTLLTSDVEVRVSHKSKAVLLHRLSRIFSDTASLETVSDPPTWGCGPGFQIPVTRGDCVLCVLRCWLSVELSQLCSSGLSNSPQQFLELRQEPQLRSLVYHKERFKSAGSSRAGRCTGPAWEKCSQPQ